MDYFGPLIRSSPALTNFLFWSIIAFTNKLDTDKVPVADKSSFSTVPPNSAKFNVRKIGGGKIGASISLLSHPYLGTFAGIVKKKSAENYGGSPYIASLLSCALWTFYGVLDPDDGILVMTVNAVGVVFQVTYLALLLLYFPKEKKVKYIGFVILDIIFFGTVMVITMVVFHDGARRTFMGVLCATFTIIMYAAPLTVVNSSPKQMCVEEGSIDMSKEHITKIEDFEEEEKQEQKYYGDEANKVTNQSFSKSLRNPSLARQYSFKQFMIKAVSLKRSDSTCHENNDVENGSKDSTGHESNDVENGNITKD
ncbi:hypothetical protein LguiB_006259 [Lonicera macranthoides]